jgi:hypothetical protein
MAKAEQEYLLELRGRNICPNCGKNIPEGTCVAYGAGGFCSLDCVAEYNKQELLERAKRVSEIAERHRNS